MWNLPFFFILASFSRFIANYESFGHLSSFLILVTRRSSLIISSFHHIANHDVILSSMGIIGFCPYMSFTYVNFVRKLWVGLFARRKPESFNDTIGEIENILDLSPHEQHTIQVNSINMYTVIDECRRGIMEELVKV